MARGTALATRRSGGGTRRLAAAARHGVRRHRRSGRAGCATGRANTGRRRGPPARATARRLNMAALQGVGVLVTRPEQQAMPLCRLLEIEGASTLRLPAIEIKPIGNRRETAAQLGALADFDVIVFTSSNALRFLASLLDQQRDPTLAAIRAPTGLALH